MRYIDLHGVLSEWEYDAELISARKVVGGDGRIKIQMRVELGLLQMEAEGRPDGVRPHEHASLCAYVKQRKKQFARRGGRKRRKFQLTPEMCADLCDEASLYYRRYVALFVLEDFEGVIRDTSHNLQILDLLQYHAREVGDRDRLEQFRPYVLMMNARARAYQAIGENDVSSAVAHTNRGLSHIQAYLEETGRPEVFDTCEEVRVLIALRDDLAQQMPEDSLMVTRKALREAIEQDRFEEAAELHERLREINQNRTAL